jgi:hypothetical protein
MYMSANYLVCTGLQATDFDFLTLLATLFADCSFERAGYLFFFAPWVALFL